MINTNSLRALLLMALLLLPLGSAQALGFFEKMGRDFNNAVSGRSSAPAPVPQPPPPPPKEMGVMKKSANIRSGPGTNHAKLGLASKGTPVEIVAKKPKWFYVDTVVGSGPVTGWVYAPLVTLGSDNAASVASVQRPAVAIVAPSTAVSYAPGTAVRYSNAQLGRGSAVTPQYAGYSAEFQPVKEMLYRGDLAGVDSYYQQQTAEARQAAGHDESKLVDKVGLLNWIEQGTLSIDQGRFDQAANDFAFAERILDQRQESSKVSDSFFSVLTFAAETVTLQGDYDAYEGEGYERVLMLNYKSIAYLLKGDERAYNVARRSIDWQRQEQRKFEEIKQEAEKNLVEAEQGDSNSSLIPGMDDGDFDSQYRRLDRKAATVASAYVNPFGYYMAGMIQEFESYDDASLRDNALIAYKKALKLNPGSKVLKKAVKDLGKRKPQRGRRLIHVVVADGFVPEKKLLTYWMNMGRSGRLPIKLTIYEPVVSKVHRIEVQTTGGKKLATLSTVADVEAICLRNQKDHEPMRQLKVAVAVASSVTSSVLLNSLGGLGQMVNQYRNESATPDMRSWESLPSSLLAARILLRPGISKLKLVTFDQRGRKLATKTIAISKKSHDFVYARSIDKQLFVHASENLWVRGK